MDYRTGVDALESRKISCSTGNVTANARLVTPLRLLQKLKHLVCDSLASLSRRVLSAEHSLRLSLGSKFQDKNVARSTVMKSVSRNM